MPNYTADVSVSSISELITEMNNATADTIIDATNSDNDGLVPQDTVIDGSGCLVFTNTEKHALLRCEETGTEVKNATLIGASGDSFSGTAENAGVWIFNSDVHVENVRCRNWMGSGIAIGTTSTSNRYTPTIAGCDLINNRSSGYGYGIGIFDGFPDISECYLNGNKHQIACSGTATAGYEAYQNYIGDHYDTFGFEMHDPGGEKFIIHHNTFEFAHDSDGNIRHNVVMRGESTELSEVYNNWIHNPNAPPDSGDETGSVGDGSAIRQDTTSDTFVNLDVHDNHFGSSDPGNESIGQSRVGDTRLHWTSQAEWESAQSRNRIVTTPVGVKNAGDFSLGWDPSFGVASDSVSYWTFDEAADNFIDEVGTNDLTPTGIQYAVTGPIGTRAAHFDGTDDYATATTTTDPTGGGSFSIMAWVDKDTSTSIDTIIRTGQTDPGAFFLDYRSDTEIGFGFYDSTETSHFDPDFHLGTTFAGTSHLLVATFDESTGDLTVYHNGTADTVNVSGTRPSGADDINVGRSPVSGNPRYMNGSIGGVILWDRALSSTEANELTDTLSSGSLTTATKAENGVVGHLSVNGNVPTTIAGEADATVHNSAGESETIYIAEGNNKYSLSNFSSTDGSFWVEFNLGTSSDNHTTSIYSTSLTVESPLTIIGTVPIQSTDGTQYDVPIYDRTELENEGFPTGHGARATNGAIGAFKIVDVSQSKLHVAVGGTIYAIDVTE